MIDSQQHLKYLTDISNKDVTKLKLPPGAKIISNSEVDAFGTCERKHLFAFGYNKEPKFLSRSLAIGVCGHEILAVFYKSIKHGMTKKQAELTTMQHLSQFYIKGTYDPDVLNLVATLISRYIPYETISTTCEVLAVEEDFYMPIRDDYWYGMRLDLLVRVLVGKERGNVMLIDHKFTYDFFTDTDLDLNPQMPKYVPAVRLSGYPVHQAYINQIRWRFSPKVITEKNKTDEELFRFTSVGLTQARIRSAVKQQMMFSERILERRKLPFDLQIEESPPNQNKMVCRNCSFTKPCIMMSNEEDISGIMFTNYQDRTYGYSKHEIEA